MLTKRRATNVRQASFWELDLSQKSRLANTRRWGPFNHTAVGDAGVILGNLWVEWSWAVAGGGSQLSRIVSQQSRGTRTIPSGSPAAGPARLCAGFDDATRHV